MKIHYKNTVFAFISKVREKKILVCLLSTPTSHFQLLQINNAEVLIYSS